MSWANLRAAFPTLSPAQLHWLLTQYQVASMSTWEPGVQDSPDAFKSDDVLESYGNPPPIVWLSEGFQVDIEADCPDESIYQHLLYIRQVLWGLQSRPSPSGGADQACATPPLRDIPRARAAPRLPGPLAEEPVQLAPWACFLLWWLPMHSASHTQLGLRPTAPNWPKPDSTCGKVFLEVGRNGPSGFGRPRLEGDCAFPRDDQPPPAPCSGSSSTEDFCYVFPVELECSPSGLGMGLIDGMHTPLGAPGLYMQTLLPGSPAASESRLCPRDCILEVNGSSLLGISFLRAADLIWHRGTKMRFLVAKSDVETARKIRSTCHPPGWAEGHPGVDHAEALPACSH
ncbi:hypothetical protein MC885_013021, partial [Smutsia gigantea]